VCGRLICINKFHLNRSRGFWDVAIFCISWLPYLTFKNAEILLADHTQRAKKHSRAKFHQNLSICCGIIALFQFSRWQPCAILDLFGAYLDHPWRVLGCLYHCAKFGCNRCSSFENMKVRIFACLAWKRLFVPQKSGFWRNFTHKMNNSINENQKKDILAQVHIIWAVKHENLLTGLTCRWVPKKKV